MAPYATLSSSLFQSQRISSLLVRRYSVELQEVAGNCAVSGQNPRNVFVTAGTTTDEEFVIDCP